MLKLFTEECVDKLEKKYNYLSNAIYHWIMNMKYYYHCRKVGC